MRAWPSLAALMVVTIGSSLEARMTALHPARQTAILAGAAACVGTTVDPSGVDTRLAGWRPAPAGSIRTDGRALTRENVLLAVTPGRDGACMVVARAGNDFSALRLLGELKRRYGVQMRSDAPPVLRLANGEIMRINAGAQHGGPTYIQLALVNAKGK